MKESHVLYGRERREEKEDQEKRENGSERKG